MTSWLPSVLTAAGLLTGYLVLLARPPSGLPAWPGWRTAAWVAGALTVAVALVPPLVQAATTDPRAHMTQHLLLGMYAPLGLVAATPVRLALGSLPTVGARRLSALLRSRPARVLSQGTVSVMGAYGPIFNAVKFGDALNKGLTLRMNQAPVKRQWPRLFEHIRNGHLKPSEIVTHRIPLEHIAEGYHLFSAKLDGCIKPLIVPSAS